MNNGFSSREKNFYDEMIDFLYQWTDILSPTVMSTPGMTNIIGVFTMKN